MTATYIIKRNVSELQEDVWSVFVRMGATYINRTLFACLCTNDSNLNHQFVSEYPREDVRSALEATGSSLNPRYFASHTFNSSRVQRDAELHPPLHADGPYQTVNRLSRTRKVSLRRCVERRGLAMLAVAQSESSILWRKGKVCSRNCVEERSADAAPH